MIGWLKHRRNLRAKAGEVYGAVVAGARSPYLYSQFGLPDTPEGRLEMLLAMLFMTLERLRRIPGRDSLVQAVLETFVTDMDDCLREMGVGDLTVPKKVKRAAAAFYARADGYGPLLSQGNAAALAKELAVALGAAGIASNHGGLAQHLIEVSRALACLSDEDVLQPACLQANLTQPTASARVMSEGTRWLHRESE